MSSETNFVPIKVQKYLVEIGLGLLILVSCGSVLGVPIYTYFSTLSIPASFFSFLFSLLIPIILIPTTGSTLSDYHDFIVEEMRKDLPPHEYDEEVKFWKPLDKIEVETEGGGVYTRKFISFTDEGTVILGLEHEGVDREDIESNDFSHDDFINIEEVKLQNLHGYKNVSYEEREFNYEKKRKILKAKSSQYNETLSKLREIEKDKLKALEEIYNGKDEIERLDEELEEELKKEVQPNKKETVRRKLV